MSYGNPPPPPGAYDPAAVGYAQPRTSGLAVASLITGILGIFPCFTVGIVGILAIVFGLIARKNIDKAGGAQKGRGMATAGLVCGIIGVVIGIGFWILAISTGNTSFTYSS